MQFSQKWEKSKKVSHSFMADKTNFETVSKTTHLFALPVVESGQKKKKSNPYWFNGAAYKAGK